MGREVFRGSMPYTPGNEQNNSIAMVRYDALMNSEKVIELQMHTHTQKACQYPKIKCQKQATVAGKRIPNAMLLPGPRVNALFSPATACFVDECGQLQCQGRVSSCSRQWNLDATTSTPPCISRCDAS